VISGADHRARIDRSNAVLVLPSGYPAPNDAHGRLDRIMRSSLPHECAKRLETLLPDDGAVWFIRRLDVEAVVDLALDDVAVAGLWADGILDGLTRTLAGSESGNEFMHFPDRATYLASFLEDLVAGHAWDRWYYAQLDSLRQLPTGVAIREALVRDVEEADAALVMLAATGRLGVVLSAMSPTDLRRVLDACIPRGSGMTAGDSALDAVLAVWADAAIEWSSGPLARARNALRLYVAVRGRGALLSGSELRAAIDVLVWLAAIGHDPSQLSAPFPGQRDGGALSVDPTESVEEIAASRAALRSLSAAAIERARRVVTSATKGLQARSGAMTDLTSMYGAIFLLLPAMEEIGVDDLVSRARYSAPTGMDVQTTLRMIVALKCLGSSRTQEALDDPIVQLAVGAEHTVDTKAVSAIAASATARGDEALLAGLVEILAARGRLEGRALAIDVIRRGRTEALALRDVSSDGWAFAWSLRGPERARTLLARGLALFRHAGLAAEHCILDSRAAERIDASALAALGLHPLSVEAPALPNDLREQIAIFRERAGRLGEELDHFSLQELQHRARFDLVWTLVARAVLRTFARRLTGFAWSGPDFLFRNFLAGESTVRVSERAIEVELPEMPLQLVLRLAGVDGQTYRVPWLGERQVVLSLRRG
jgi:hypothetical protein